MNPMARAKFDGLLEEVLAELPAHIHDLLDEMPLVVDDEPSRELFESLGMDPRESDLCGLYSGRPLTHRSVEQSGVLPDRVQIFRGPIARVARAHGVELKREIRITVLHEIGHHFGLDEDQLKALGYA
jgi:predicted Zn-dependent protease with MMP-like domain